jgi:hypothetical protein
MKPVSRYRASSTARRARNQLIFRCSSALPPEAVAFTALESVQQDAKREFIASEFAELFNLRQSISAPKRHL